MENPDEAISDWFAGIGQSFENKASRTDWYLPLDKQDVTVKLREGNIEIKHRSANPEKGSLTSGAVGMFENWIKWSFNADKTDRLSQEIISNNPYQWTETIKTRTGVKVTGDATGNLLTVPIEQRVEYGCQIEYTLLKVWGGIFYTFALEWFGNKEFKLPEELIKEILGTARLRLEDSMGYGEFLNKIESAPKANYLIPNH